MTGMTGMAGMAGVAGALLIAVCPACSSDEIADPPTSEPVATSVVASGDSDAAAATSATVVPATAPATPSTAALPTVPPTTPPAGSAQPADTGVPGLDSGDAFCAAWSRFGGSWQVVLASAVFGDADEAMRLEVIASGVVGDAYEALFAVWPEPLASERQLVADGYFGPFQRRSLDALAALADAGADDAAVDRLAAVWVDALARRDPSEPSITVTVPDDLADAVEAAAATFAARRVPLPADPSMVITASTPLTDDYLTTACPDQGSIVGQDFVDG